MENQVVDAEVVENKTDLEQKATEKTLFSKRVRRGLKFAGVFAALAAAVGGYIYLQNRA